MPPCAHNEWERRQGTNENTSQSWPASAILMTAIRPASPPPTTMKRGLSLALDESTVVLGAMRVSLLGLLDGTTRVAGEILIGRRRGVKRTGKGVPHAMTT